MRPSMMLMGSAAFVLLICGCNGEIRTRMWDRNGLEKELQKKCDTVSEGELKKECGIKGVVGYYTKSVKEISNYTQFINTDGKITGTCNPVQVQKVVIVTDYDHPYQVWYSYGLLEANKFGVQMSNSVFTAINSESAPDQGKTIESLAHAFSMVKPPVAPAPPKPGTPGCNSGASFDRYEALPPLP